MFCKPSASDMTRIYSHALVHEKYQTLVNHHGEHGALRHNVLYIP